MAASPVFQGRKVEPLDVKVGEGRGACNETPIGLHEGRALLSVRSNDGGRIWNAPMRDERMAGPIGTCFARRQSQTVTMKSILGASGVLNSSQLFERIPAVSYPSSLSSAIAVR